MSCTCHVSGITSFVLTSLSITTEYYPGIVLMEALPIYPQR